MKLDAFSKRARQISRPFRITKGSNFRLKHIDPGDMGEFSKNDRPHAEEALAEGVRVLSGLQDILYAQDRWALLVIFQAMDAAGKDGALRHVMSGVNPQGCQVYSFKAPSAEDLDHDYLWRCMKCLPERGRIGIFNRSYYEEVLIVRVHKEILDGQRIPQELVRKDIFDGRLADIRNFERYLSRNGVGIVKFFLHVSKEEQKRRFLSRLDVPSKQWKFSSADVKEREYWNDYMSAYEEAIRATATEYAPWYVVPADHKWFTRLVVSSALIDTLSSLDLSYPTVDGPKRAALAAVKRALQRAK
jgi:PPK2 family polyphosphate:nucleotide phosphotransferase